MIKINSKKAMTPVVVISLFIFIVIVATFNISTWYYNLSSEISSDIEGKGIITTFSIDDVIGENLYLSSTKKEVFVNSITINNVDCSYSGLLYGLDSINISSCITNVSGPVNIAIFTDDGVFSTSKYITNRGNLEEEIVEILDIVGYNSTFGQWVGGTGNYYINDINVDSNGSIYVGGSGRGTTFDDGLIAMTGAPSATNYNGFLLKFNSSGDSQWGYWISDGGEYSHIFSLAVDSENNVYVGGDSYSGPLDNVGSMSGSHSWDYDGFLLKFNSSGNPQGGQWIGGSSQDYIYSLAVDNDDNIFVVGKAYSSSFDDGFSPSSTHSGNDEGYILKFNSSISYQWGHWIGGIRAEEITSIAVDSKNDVYVGGSTLHFTTPVVFSDFSLTGNSSFSSFKDEGFLMKFNSSGSYQWGQWIGSANDDEITDITVDDTDNIIVTGTAKANITDDNLTFLPGFGFVANDVFLLKFNSTGGNLWSTWIQNALNPYTVHLDSDSQGNIYVEYEDSTTAAILIFNSSGQYKSNISIGVNYDQGIDAIVIDENDNLYFAGEAATSGFNNELVPPSGTFTNNDEGYFFKFDPLYEE
jgi:hypothetical protein